MRAAERMSSKSVSMCSIRNWTISGYRFLALTAPTRSLAVLAMIGLSATTAMMSLLAVLVMTCSAVGVVLILLTVATVTTALNCWDTLVGRIS